MEKIFELINYGEIVSFYDHGTHVVEVSLFLDERRSLEPQSVTLTHEEAQRKIALLRDKQA
ncbi:hypothetical protein Pcar_3338 [Syntrophotalea carbinolica DSM 2380]|uniref:Uncharacterized protein n=1 Tax=Syntrophotalea carbinolica (strain DSM 2380 / NBRC 103641 / GraBd1) TaxID=338963 RepID=Q0C6I4_SYNC1|nr:hypothetical protein [Syntrophotalea carbinolica]ABI81954.1 hypothetical protein Pcar_3338 [Syntrophotalea carbinolica DSM 2380]